MIVFGGQQTPEAGQRLVEAQQTEGTKQGPALEAVEGQLWGRFATFMPVYRRWMRSRLKDRGIGYAWMRALGALHHGEGPLIMSDLGEDRGGTPRNGTELCDWLEAKAPVRRLSHPSD